MHAMLCHKIAIIIINDITAGTYQLSIGKRTQLVKAS